MSWGRNDQAVTANSTTTKEASNGAPIGAWVNVKKGGSVAGAAGSANAHFGNTSAGSRANVDSNLFGNVTPGAFIPNMAVGVFGVSSKMLGIVDSPLNTADVLFHGSGYLANAVVTITAPNGGGSGTVNAQANSTGRISALNIAANGSAYKPPVTIAIAAPAAQTFNANSALQSAQTINANTSLYDQVSFNANTGVSANVILPNNQPFSIGDFVQYTTGAGQTAVTGLTNATSYYVVLANTTAVALALTPGGAQIPLTKGLTATTGEFLTKYNFVYTAAANPFANGTIVQYAVAASNTVISPLTNGSSYLVTTSNSLGFAVANISTGAIINVVPGVTETGHTFTRFNFIAVGSSVYQNGDVVTYANAAGNTAIVPLVNGNNYIVTQANSSGFSLAANAVQYNAGQFIALTPGKTEAGHSVTGQTATGIVTIGGSAMKAVTHAGWVLRREGTGGRAGRVQYETLVAMGSLGAQTAAYGTPALVANASGTSNGVFPSAN